MYISIHGCLQIGFFIGLILSANNAHAAKPESKLPDNVTFADHIAPLVYGKCTSCHRPDQSGPFTLITYQDVRKRAETIQAVVNDRHMPPWHPVAGHVEYQNERRLSDEQIALFNRWVETGCAEGDPAKTPKPPTYPDGWQLGKPDLVVQMKDAYQVAADGPDVYRSFVFPVALPEDKWVKAVELRPTARSAVHHAIFFLNNDGTARKMDGRDGKPGINGMGFGITGALGGYVPGATPAFLPGDLALPLDRGSDIIMQTHFHPSGKPETEQATIALYFADKPPAKKIVPIQVPPIFGRSMGIDVPAGEKNYTIKDSFRLPYAAEAISIGGHAHYICREMKMTAAMPDGSTKTLMEIDDWDLGWQDRYFFREPISLPAGTVLETTIVYDNSSDNPQNPFSPPQRIRWGRESTDEMGSVTLMVIPADKKDQDRLAAAARRNSFLGIAGSLTNGNRNDDDKAIPRVDDLPEILKQLDTNNDGKLQRSEKPERLTDRVFDRLDADKNDELDASELRLLRRLIEQLQDK